MRQVKAELLELVTSFIAAMYFGMEGQDNYHVPYLSSNSCRLQLGILKLIKVVPLPRQLLEDIYGIFISQLEGIACAPDVNRKEIGSR